MATEKKDDFGELSIEQQAYESMESNVQKVLAQLSQEPSLERFRQEYEKLHRAMKVSHDNESKLLKKCRELNADIIGNATKVNGAIKMTQDDSNTIQFLKSELEKTYKVLEISKEREDKNKQKVDNLYAEVKHLNNILDQGCFLNNGQSDTVQELVDIQAGLTQERNEKNAILNQLKQDFNVFYENNRRFIVEKNELENDLKSMRQQNDELNEKIKKDEDRKKKITDELSNIKLQFEKSKKDTENIDNENKKLLNDKDQLSIQLKQKEDNNMKTFNKLKELTDSLGQIKTEYSGQTEKLYSLQQQRSNYSQRLAILRKEFNMQQQKNQQLEKAVEMEKIQLQSIQNEIKTIKDQKDIAINAIRHIEKDVFQQKKLTKEDKRLIEELKFLKEEMLKKQQLIEETSRKHQDNMILLDRGLQAKEKQSLNWSEQTQTLDQQLAGLKKEKEKYGQQASQANHKYQQSLEEIKLKHNLIQELHKKNAETEGKLKQQQQLYEAVRSDRNLYSKQLTETQDEIAEIKRRYKIVNYQITQLKEEIDAKENALSREHAEHKKKDKTIQDNCSKLEKKKAEIEEKEEKSKNQVGETGKLYFVIQESTNKRQKLKEEYETIVAERDILGTQLIRRNDESALLYEKIKIQQNILAKGESEYRERLLDIDLLNSKVRDLQRQALIIYNKAQLVPKLCEQNYALEKQLVEEKLRVKVMSDELENPMNQDRFRDLEGTDPDSYEMTAKIKNLQRRLISKTEEVIELEVVLQQKEKSIQELREIMKRQPGIEEAKIISKCQSNLKEKTRQMKSLAAQLNMDQAQLNEYKYERERIVKEIQELQRKFNEQRRRLQIQNETLKQ